MSSQCVEALLSFFEESIPELDKLYSWNIPEVEGFKSDENLSNAKNNIYLKKYLNQRWKKTSDFQSRVRLAHTVVEDWGGVRTNAAGKIESFVRNIDQLDFIKPLAGVASYSKIYSIVDLDKFVIYDARVSASLNAIQFNRGVEKGKAFNYVPSRNSIIGGTPEHKGFMQMSPFKIQSLVQSGWERMKKDDTYSEYLDLLAECLRFLPNNKIYELEMVLFSVAERECCKAMSMIGVLSERCNKRFG